MSIKTPYQQTLIDAWKLAEMSRKASGMFAPRKPEDLFITKPDGKRKYRVKSYKITLWLTAPQYVDLLRQKVADQHVGSLTSYITKGMLENLIPPTAARPEPRPTKKEKAEKVLASTKLRNGHRPGARAA